MEVTSAESNVASVSSYLGLPVKVLTAFVKDSPISRMIKDDLAARHMDYEGREVDQGGPWGYRHQINLADTGYGSRGPRVHNDRAGEVEAVNRIVVDLFDTEYGFSQTIVRYARSSESDRVVEILRSHIPADLCHSEACQIDVIEGRVVQHLPQRASRRMLTGLEG